MIFDVDGNRIDTAYDENSSLMVVYNKRGDVVWRYDDVHFLDTAIITALPSVSTTGTKQGCCTDGEYIYQTAGDSTNHTYMQIIKYKISDGTYTVARFDGTPNFGHANAMTYNPNTGHIYVGTMLSDGSVIVLNPSDLSYVETRYLVNSSGQTYGVSALAYDRTRNCYYTKSSATAFNVYDADFNFLHTIPAAETLSATAQDCETDGRYIYRVTYNPNYFDVIDIDTGERAKIITNPMMGEPEALAYDWDGNFYAARNTTGTIFYDVQLFDN